MAPNGLKPWLKHIEPILALAKPETLKELCAFIGMVNFYRTMWRHCAHIMVPLTKLTKIEQSKFKQNWALNKIKPLTPSKLSFRKMLLRYPDPNLPFDIKTDASDSQLILALDVVSPMIIPDGRLGNGQMGGVPKARNSVDFH
jgi:hypothetical protein